MMRVIGTAGHVDHGKSTLVQALTGINPDRLKEEQDREMTIDLGFAWLTLPSGLQVSIIDVPGHEAFIKNMLAGVGALDAVILVIAADEGIMPQTREHLAILNLLGINSGIVALTKSDLAESNEWLDLVKQQIRDELKGTLLENASIVPVSARKRIGLDDIKRELDVILASAPLRPNIGKPRLPIDRVFTIAGFGTVVTGTLIDGSFAIGDEVEIKPSNKRARIRGLQRHKAQVNAVEPGTRLAMNLAGVSKDEIERGQVVLRPDTFSASSMFDARLHWLGDAPRPLENNDTVDFFVSTQQVSARVRLLDKDKLEPGQNAWAQIIAGHPVIVARHDKFILRSPSPSLTLGGGTVVEPHPTTRHKRYQASVISKLETGARGAPGGLIQSYLSTRKLVPLQLLKEAVELSDLDFKEALAKLVKTNQVLIFERAAIEFAMTRATWDSLASTIVRTLEGFHRQFPLRNGMPREELKSRLDLPSREFDLIIGQCMDENLIASSDSVLHLSGFKVVIKPEELQKAEQIIRQVEREPFNAPTLKEVEESIGPELLNALFAQKRLVRLSDQVLVTPTALKESTEWVIQQIKATGQVTAAELRDHLKASRKYAIAILEYLDETRVTKRVGDIRVLR